MTVLTYRIHRHPNTSDTPEWLLENLNGPTPYYFEPSPAKGLAHDIIDHTLHNPLLSPFIDEMIAIGQLHRRLGLDKPLDYIVNTFVQSYLFRGIDRGEKGESCTVSESEMLQRFYKSLDLSVLKSEIPDVGYFTKDKLCTPAEIEYPIEKSRGFFVSNKVERILSDKRNLDLITTTLSKAFNIGRMTNTFADYATQQELYKQVQDVVGRPFFNQFKSFTLYVDTDKVEVSATIGISDTN